ncbi:hypothetical protein I2I11_04185 [Pontibacter sp. 172403-2]|uniref:hypothetical protein n=1 Tax=Pontibacter rufus TaxID=2791028 RepID=UPI0018AFDFF9|nr:hypothetical protein [Pontibacter sp. 172403-2]MBF9252483.1 hypothetical protein [Pontibacter sp. 172403-2]
MAYERYPHTLVFSKAGTESTLDGNGFIVAGAPGETVTEPCRFDDANGVGNSTVTGVDNETYRQAGTIYLPMSSLNIPERGMQVEVVDMFKGRVASTYRGQLHTSIKVY